MKLVLDASVILKLVLVQDEPDREKALRIVESFQKDLVEIILPNFWKVEVGNILIRKDSEKYENFYRTILDIGFQSNYFSNIDFINIGKFAQNHGISFYDGCYHFLAKLTNSLFITADEKHYAKTKDIGNIALLKDFKI